MKEVADWIASDKEGSAALQTTVSEHTESIDTINTDLSNLKTKVDEDIQNLSDHMIEASNVIGSLEDRIETIENITYVAITE